MIATFRKAALLTTLVAAFLPAHDVARAAPIKISGAMVNGGNVTAFGVPKATTDLQAIFIADRVTDGRPQIWTTFWTGFAPSDRTGTALLAGESVDAFDVVASTSFYIFYSATRAGKRDLWVTPINGNFAPSKISGTAVGSGVVNFVAGDDLGVLYIAEQDTASVRELYRTTQSGFSGFGTGKMSGALVTGGAVKAYRAAPGSTRIVFIAAKESATRDDLYMVSYTSPGTQTKLSDTMVPGGNVRDFQISADGTRVVYLADRDTDNKPELYSVAITGGAVTKLSSTMAGAGVKSFAISADSSHVVFTADRETANIDELYSVPITGGSLTKLNQALVTNGRVRSFRLSADGQRTAYLADAEAATAPELYATPVAGGAVIKLSGTRNDGDVKDFALSPDSTRVAFRANYDSISSIDLYSVPLSGGPRVKLTEYGPNSGMVSTFAFTPDSQRLVHLVRIPAVSVPQLESAFASGGGRVRLSGEMIRGGFVSAFTISADSSTVVFQAVKSMDLVNELYAAPVNGGPLLDIDGDGQITTLVDGLLLSRWMLGLRGAALIANITFPVGATRTTEADITAQLLLVTSAAQ